jgi:hypothetical protein
MKSSSLRFFAAPLGRLLPKILLALALAWGPCAPSWAQSDEAPAVDNSAEYAFDPLPSRAPPMSTQLVAGAAVVAGAFVVGIVAAGTATGGLVAAGAAALLYAALP